MFKKAILISIFILFFTSIGTAQEHQAESAEHISPDHTVLHHRLSAGFGYTFIPDGSEEPEGKKGILVPTLSLEYFYKFSHQWVAGLMVDAEMSQYLIPFLDDFSMNREVVEYHNRWDAGITAMVDYFFMPEKKMKSLRLSLKYYYGLTDILKDNPGDAVNNSIFLLSLGIPVGGSDEKE